MISKRTSRAYVTHADTAPGFWMIGVLWRVLATSIQTGNSMCLLDQICSTGSGPTRHTHTQDEGLYVASGKVTFNAAGTELTAYPGSFVTVPRHTEHSFIVDEDAVLINFYFPAGFDLWLMGSAVPAQRNELPPSDAPPPDAGMMKKLSGDYGGLPMTKERSTTANPDALVIPTMSSRRIAQNVWFNGGCWSILADATTTGGSYSVFEVELPQGVVDRPHVHDASDEAYYLFEGELEFFVDDRVFRLVKGSFIFVPRGSVHAFRVASETVRFLNMHTSPGYERVIRACGTIVTEPVLPPPDWRRDDPSPERLREVHGRHWHEGNRDTGRLPSLAPAGATIGQTAADRRSIQGEQRNAHPPPRLQPGNGDRFLLAPPVGRHRFQAEVEDAGGNRDVSRPRRRSPSARRRGAPEELDGGGRPA